MAKLPDEYEKNYLELLIPNLSEATKKNRRNLLVASFVIVAIYLLEMSITKLKVFGLELSESDGVKVIGFAFAMLGYWYVMFLGHITKDDEIHNERRRQALGDLLGVEKAYWEAKQKFENAQDSTVHRGRYQSTKNEFLRHDNLRIRTKWARRLSSGFFLMENLVPIIMTSFAVYLLSEDFFGRVQLLNLL